MNLAQVMAGAGAGGAELFFERMCGALHAAGDSVLPIIRANPDRAARLAATGLQPRQLRFGGLLDPFTEPRLRKILRAAAPAVVMAWMGRAARMTPRGDFTLVGRLGGRYDLRRFARCHHLVGNTTALVDWLVREGRPAGQCHYLPNFVADLRGTAPASRAALGVPDDAPLLLGLGRLHRAKGFDLIIRALPGLPGAHAVIAGEGPERATLQRLALAQGVAARVHLPGWRQDTGALLAACDVFVCSSRLEPLGNMVLEAWSAARPVVAAAADGPAGLIRPAADGWLVPLEDVPALARAIAEALANRARATDTAAAGRARYAAAFTEALVVAQWQAFHAMVAA